MRIFASPQTYIQRFNAFETELFRLKRLGEKALIVTDSFVMHIAGEKLIDNLKRVDIKSIAVLVDKSSQTDFLLKMETTIQNGNFQFVIALGGGKAMDLGKIVANINRLPIAVLPTSAATDAATSRISVIYDEAGNFLHYDYYDKNPEIILVDTKVIFAAPQAMLVSGFADGIATYIEARSVWEDCGLSVIGAKPTLAALSLAKTCHEVLIRDIKPALQAQKDGIINEAFENVVECNILLSGLGFENGGLSLAHSFHNVIMGDNQLNVTRSHGQIVAVGLLMQLLVEKRITEFNRHQQLFTSLKLPTRLPELDLHLSQTVIKDIAKKILLTKDAGNYLNKQIDEAKIVTALTKLA
ncbi:glycerol dehydrogenase [Enterococcus saigonensis]|uniref:Glycerol dehydrogenase n=1 Tax=Enterococcus saigonensis TaxID=1805431 RepID=A0A679IPP7_9ENTE|nr:iron-containing alcohol dehydrogenase [Enterococcus saigonensis]BCA85834.1 glycerol dehydrogenase [Enterococcus saigonensis]